MVKDWIECNVLSSSRASPEMKGTFQLLRVRSFSSLKSDPSLVNFIKKYFRIQKTLDWLCGLFYIHFFVFIFTLTAGQQLLGGICRCKFIISVLRQKTFWRGPKTFSVKAWSCPLKKIPIKTSFHFFKNATYSVSSGTVAVRHRLQWLSVSAKNWCCLIVFCGYW